ncbi:MAG TPA: response regulator [Opitutaceae bacterium]|nr:response regulator [Opitutaceae bacterium]
MRPPFLRDSLSEHALAGGGNGTFSPTLLIVDDDAHMLQALGCYFARRSFNVATARTVGEAKDVFAQQKLWTLVISDYHLPDGTGMELKAWLEAQPGGAPPFLLMSGSIQGSAAALGLDFLAKPFALADLEGRLRILLRGHSG